MYNLHVAQISLAFAICILSNLGYCAPDAVHPTLPAALSISKNNSLSMLYPTEPSFSTIIPFHVPSTAIYLHIRFPRTHARRHPLSQHSIGGILALANDTIYQHITDEGAGAFVDWLNPEGTRQQFVEVLSNEVVFGFLGLIDGPRFTWGQLRDVVRGLYLYLVVGRRFWETDFQVTEGSRFAGLFGLGSMFRPVEY